MRNYRLYLEDILHAIESIQAFVAGMSLEGFRQDDKTSSAVFRKFEIIGEAAKHIPEGIRQKYPQVPWREMARMRDRLIHGYFGIDHQEVWRTIGEELPALKSHMQEILEDLR